MYNDSLTSMNFFKFQGGGPDTEEKPETDPLVSKQCMFLPTEVIAVTERMDTVEVGRLAVISSEFQVHQAISKLYKTQEEHPNKFVYIQFPFGNIDYSTYGITTKCVKRKLG